MGFVWTLVFLALSGRKLSSPVNSCGLCTCHYGLWVVYVSLRVTESNDVYVRDWRKHVSKNLRGWWKHVSEIQTVSWSCFAAFCATYTQVKGKAANSQVKFVMSCSLGSLVSNSKSGFSLLWHWASHFLWKPACEALTHSNAFRLFASARERVYKRRRGGDSCGLAAGRPGLLREPVRRLFGNKRVS